MNTIFAICFIISLTILCLFSPDSVLSAISVGGGKAVALTLKMMGIYVFWLGIMQIIFESGLHKKLSNLLSPLTSLLFGKIDREAKDLVTTNICLNMLGLGNSATPVGIKCIQRLGGHSSDKLSATYPMVMFFVINATSVQLLPTTVISLLSECGSSSPYSIILPSIFISFICTFIGVILVKVFVKYD